MSQTKSRVDAAIDALSAAVDEHRAEEERLRRKAARYLHDAHVAEAEVERLRGLLLWAYREHGADWALVCDEECEIATLTKTEEP